MRELTSTSYAILGLLSVRSWSAYELAKQMDRSLTFFWPRAESVVYEEPKNLVEHGLAHVSVEPRGLRRTRAVYSITPKGRRTFRRWLTEPSAPPQFESEALVRAMFAEQGTKEDLLKTLAGLRDHAHTLYRAQAAQGADYLRTGGPFPQRLHLIALTGRFILDYLALLEHWATWAEHEVQQWPDVKPVELVPVATDAFRATLDDDDDDEPSTLEGAPK